MLAVRGTWATPQPTHCGYGARLAVKDAGNGPSVRDYPVLSAASAIFGVFGDCRRVSG
jgi:hypothetical protein